MLRSWGSRGAGQQRGRDRVLERAPGLKLASWPGVYAPPAPDAPSRLGSMEVPPGLLAALKAGGPRRTIHCQKTSSRRRHARAASRRAFSLSSLRSSCKAKHTARPGQSPTCPPGSPSADARPSGPQARHRRHCRPGHLRAGKAGQPHLQTRPGRHAHGPHGVRSGHQAPWTQDLCPTTLTGGRSPRRRAGEGAQNGEPAGLSGEGTPPGQPGNPSGREAGLHTPNLRPPHKQVDPQTATGPRAAAARGVPAPASASRSLAGVRSPTLGGPLVTGEAQSGLLEPRPGPSTPRHPHQEATGLHLLWLL